MYTRCAGKTNKFPPDILPFSRNTKERARQHNDEVSHISRASKIPPWPSNRVTETPVCV